MRARAADEVGVERRCSARASGGERFGRLLKLAQPGVDVLKLRSGVAAASPKAGNDKHQAKDQGPLTSHCQTYGVIPEQHLGRR